MDEKKSKISVVIPCFDQSGFLAQAIESVLQQTLKPLEILCINDGSQDNSLQVAQSYENQGVKIINQVNKGLASARNTGIMNATGDFVMPLDADDMMLENCLEKIAEVIENNPDVDIVAPSLKEFGMRNTEIILMPNPTIEDFKTANRIGYFSAIRKSCLLEVGGYSPKMVFGYEDYHLWANLLTLGKKLITIPEVLILYRVKEKSMLVDAVSHHDELMAQIYKDFPNFK